MDVGDSIIVGSAIFGTVGLVIKWISFKSGKATNGQLAVSRKTLDEILEKRLRVVVQDAVCKARHEGLERHVEDVFKHVCEGMKELKANQIEIFQRLRGDREELLSRLSEIKGKIK